jgi:branched-chain amino acid transport system substrate-binding protein
VSDADAFRAALKEADFASTRGDFEFNTNNHPIQDIYVREVIKEGDVITNKIDRRGARGSRRRLRRTVQHVT